MITKERLKQVLKLPENAKIKGIIFRKVIVENLEYYGEQLEKLKEQLEESLIYRPRLYERSNGHDENFEWEEEAWR